MTTTTVVRKEMAVIPLWSIIAAAIIFTAIPVFFYTFVWAGDSGQPPFFMKIFVSFLPGLFLAFLTLMVGYVNVDARRRGMNRVLWTLVVIFVPNAIGFILYFLMRNPIRLDCPKCGTMVDLRTNYCPSCRHSFHPTCPECKSSVKPGDTFCGNCGSQINQVA
jgi:hypothetical protein